MRSRWSLESSRQNRERAIKWHAQQEEALPFRLAGMAPSTKDMIAGFFDGDGHVAIKKQTKKSRLGVRVCIAQSYNSGEPPELVWLQSIFGGLLRNLAPATDRVRARWSLEINNRMELLVLLECVSQHGIVKQAQAEIALAMLREEFDDGDSFAAIKLARACTDEIVIDSDRLTVPYLTGLFAAEGSIGMPYGSPVLEIAQTCCPQLLAAIKAKHGGLCNRRHWKIGMDSGVYAFASAIRSHLVGQKKPQVDLACKFIEEKTARGWLAPWPRSAEKTTQIEQTKKQLKVMKKL